MTSKKRDKVTTTGNLPALRIGSRVRCTDDGVEGRIVWANAVAVKIQWDDGEQITWRRDALADKPIDILDPSDEEGQAGTNAAAADGEQAIPAASLPAEPAMAHAAAEAASTEGTPPAPEPTQEPITPSLADGAAKRPAKPKRRRKEPATPKEKKLSVLDAAAQVLAEQGKPMNCQEMIAVMAAKDYWTSPAGKTPHATLYSALLRETTTKRAASRFVKVERGKFALTNPA